MAIDYTGTLREESNDPDSPQDVALIGQLEPFIAPVSFASYAGSGTIVGTTEFGDVSDPPRKYRDKTVNGVALIRQEEPPDSGLLSPLRVGMRNRVHFNAAGTKTEQMAYDQAAGNQGLPWLFGSPFGPEPVGTPWECSNSFAAGSFGTAVLNSFEEYVPQASEGYENDWVTSYLRAKRKKSYTLADVQRATDEETDSPGFVYQSQEIGSAIDTTARTNVRFNAVFAITHWNIYVNYGMENPPVGSGPATTLFVVATPGNQDLDASSGGVDVIHLTAPAGSGTQWQYAKFSLPLNTSFKFRLEITGETDEQFPEDWASNPDPITNEDFNDAGYDPWFYLGSDGTVGDHLSTEYAEFLTTEDSPVDILTNPATPGVTISDELWAQTLSFTGGLTAESEVPIDFTMRIVQGTFTITGLTPLRQYDIELTYAQRPIGGGVTTLVKETILVVPGLDTFKEVVVNVIAPIGFERRLVATSQLGSAPVVIQPAALKTLTLLWKGQVEEEGGTYLDAHVTAIDNLAIGLNALSLRFDLYYFMPFCGNDLAACLTPLIDRDRFGQPTNVNSNFVEGDYTPSTGLTGAAFVSDPTAKILLVPFNMSLADPSAFGRIAQGFGYVVARDDGTGDTPMGMWADPTNKAFNLNWNLGLTRWAFYHGDTANGVNVAPESQNDGDFMFAARFSATDRRIWRNGVEIGNNVTNDTAADLNDFLFGIHGRNQQSLVNVYSPTPSSIGYAFYATATSNMNTDAQIGALQTVLDAYMTEMGRI